MTEEQKQKHREANKRYRETHKEQERERKRKYREANKDKVKAYAKRYREKHYTDILAKHIAKDTERFESRRREYLSYERYEQESAEDIATRYYTTYGGAEW
jgi:hypothetical protein